MIEKKRRRLRAYPAEMPLVCLVRAESLKNLARCLERAGVNNGSLYFNGRLCLGISVRTKELKRLLPEICEHSEAVCIGDLYRELLAEHGSVLIGSGAVTVLNSSH